MERYSSGLPPLVSLTQFPHCPHGSEVDDHSSDCAQDKDQETQTRNLQRDQADDCFGHWKGLDDLEIATCAWVSWFNEVRLHSDLSDGTSSEVEADYREQSQPQRREKTKPPILHQTVKMGSVQSLGGLSMSEETGPLAAKAAKAEAKAAIARAKSLRPWFKKKRFIIPGIIIVVIAISAAAGGGENTSTTATVAQGAGGNNNAVTTTSGASTAGFGTIVKDGAFSFRATQLVCNIHNVGGSYGATATGQYCRITLWIYNHTNSGQMFDPNNQVAVDSRNRQYTGDTTADIYSGHSMSLTTINPGLSITGFVYFDMPHGDKPSYFIFHDSAYSGGVNENA